MSLIEDIAERTLPDGYVLDYLGESRELRSEGNTMAGVLLIATVLVFLQYSPSNSTALEIR